MGGSGAGEDVGEREGMGWKRDTTNIPAFFIY